MKIANSLTQLIGNTPLLEVTHIARELALPGRLLVKIEAMNPGGSVKDRIALYMIEDAERRGKLHPGDTIIEPTSGNTGIGLAWVGRVKGYHVVLTMPDTMSLERRQLLAAYGAEIVLTPGAKGMKGAIAEAERLCNITPGAIVLGQFRNVANVEAHYRTTAQEIWRDTDGNVDYFVAGVGTGGTIVGTGRGLKEHRPDIQIVAVEPAESAVLSGQPAGPHKIQGIGAGFIPHIYDPKVVDSVVQITGDRAAQAARLLAKEEGLLAGISSGAALAAAIDIASRESSRGKTIVALLPDTGTRYLSTGLFD